MSGETVEVTLGDMSGVCQEENSSLQVPVLLSSQKSLDSGPVHLSRFPSISDSPHSGSHGKEALWSG